MITRTMMECAGAGVFCLGLLLVTGCGEAPPPPSAVGVSDGGAQACCSGPAATESGDAVTTSGSCETVRFAVAWSTDADAAAAGKEAAETAVGALGCPAKAVMFFVYYQDPEFVPDEANQATACKVDVAAENAAAAAVAKACEETPNVGCRARVLTNGGTLLKNAVGVMAVGGEQASVATAAVPIQDDRKATGAEVAEAMKAVKDLSVVIALGEMRLSFEAKEGVSVEDFIRGVLDGTPEGTTLFGGNSMPDDMAVEDLAGAQFSGGEPLKGHVAVLGLGGPIKTFGNHTNEFCPSEETVTVTETNGKWIVALDDRPAMEVYRELRPMKDDEQLTSDWLHPVGVVVGDGKEYVRMILNWVDAEGKDKDGKASDLPPGSLCFVAPVVKGTKIKALGGGEDAAAIVATAKQGIAEPVAEARAAGVKPALCLLSNCCCRGMRLRTFREGDDDEVTEAILPAMGEEFPLFGFYAWGELGRIKGEYENLTHQYQQHTFVSAVIGVEE